MPIPSGSVLPLLDELKTHVNITSDTHDDELQDLLDAAVGVVEGYVGPLDSRTVVETHRTLNTASPLVLRQAPAIDVTSVTAGDGTLYALTDYDLDTEAGLLHLAYEGSYGRWYGQATVTYSAGRTDLPAAIRTAILIVASRLWETQRGNAPSALPISDNEGFNADPAGLPLLPPRARELLRPYLLGPSVA